MARKSDSPDGGKGGKGGKGDPEPVAGQTLIGTEGDDTLTGGDGSDVFAGLGGDDVIDGGGGDGDVALYFGDPADYTVNEIYGNGRNRNTVVGVSVVYTDPDTGATETDSLTNIEFVFFLPEGGSYDHVWANDDVAGTTEDAAVEIDVLADDDDGDPTEDEILTITAITADFDGDGAVEEADFSAGDTLVFASGATLTRQTDVGGYQTLVFDPNGAYDALATGEFADLDFAYTVTDAEGNEATAAVSVQISGRDGGDPDPSATTTVDFDATATLDDPDYPFPLVLDGDGNAFEVGRIVDTFAGLSTPQDAAPNIGDWDATDGDLEYRVASSDPLDYFSAGLYDLIQIEAMAIRRTDLSGSGLQPFDVTAVTLTGLGTGEVALVTARDASLGVLFEMAVEGSDAAPDVTLALGAEFEGVYTFTVESVRYHDFGGDGTAEPVAPYDFAVDDVALAYSEVLV